MGTPRMSGSRYVGVASNPIGRPVISNGGYGARRIYPGTYRNGRYYLPAYGVGLPYGVGWYGPDCVVGFSDCGSYDNSAYVAPAVPQDYGAGYDAQPMPPVEQAYLGPNSPLAEHPQTEPEPEDAVTLVFKDGRPAEQIHNYLLTRTTLYVQDGKRREIPVDELDLAAMVKVNHEAGVDFQLPAVPR
jgi:hypothetical protein